MKAQVVASVWIRRSETDRSRLTFRRGATIDVSQAELDEGVKAGTLRKPTDAPLPSTNHAAVDSRPRTPGGAPVEVDHEAEAAAIRAPKSHAEADEAAATLGITFPNNAKLAAKLDALAQIDKARVTSRDAVLDDLAALDDEELIQRGVDLGRTEDEMVELSHHELVQFVAEARAVAQE